MRTAAAKAFMLGADYEGADQGTRSREHAVGTSQLTELATSGREQRAQRLPAPESEALDVNAFAAASERRGRRASTARRDDEKMPGGIRSGRRRSRNRSRIQGPRTC